MCGIVGIASPTIVRTRHWLTVARDAMHHRGPDGVGEWWSADGCVGLAHRRLAVIDLSPTGHQPMADVTGELHIVFNGEIYNFLDLRLELVSKGHTFLSHSDTEVILTAYRQWGSSCLSRLNGMFSFALYDARRRELFIARDRAGEKPLFYSIIDGNLQFASELKALLAHPNMPRRIDISALDCYLSMGFVPGERCILAGVNKLPPAHALLFDLESRKLSTWRYWELPELAAAESLGDEASMLLELETLLEDAVRRQLVADVPVGVMLSGGLDSSLITALASRCASRIKTFTIRFPSHCKYDETDHARLVARHFGTEHIELEASASTVDLLPALAQQFDEPIVDSSMIPTYLVSRLIRRHCTVALGGDGGDELFGGYGHYDRLLRMQQMIGWVSQSVRLPLAKAASQLLPVGFNGTNVRTWLIAAGSNLERTLPQIAAYFDLNLRRQLIDHRHNWTFAAERIWAERVPLTSNLLQRATRMDFQNYLPEDILVKVDRASMLSSLEVRAPFLDYRLIEFAFRKVPAHLKCIVSSRKILLRKLAKRLLPSEFDQNRKQGFLIPLSSWLQTDAWWGFFSDVLLGKDSTLFNQREIRSLLNGQRKGRANSERLFALVMFELWRREYRVSI